MRFLLDENIARSVVLGLRQAGHDVLWARESMRGLADDLLLARAKTDDRVVVTFDKDFGELAFRLRLPATCGVVLFRITCRGREHDVKLVIDTLQSRQDWSGHFWTVTDDNIRQRPLP
jgi:predicted nuclease of predicted toxin-antitoxin system